MFNRPILMPRGSCLLYSDESPDLVYGPLGRTTTTQKNLTAGEKEKSGAQWVNRFPTSRDVADLKGDFKGDFKGKVQKFLAAIEAAGGSVSISATYRPPERAYLMHYSNKIAKGKIAADKVPAMAGVDIDWVHDTEAKSKEAAQAMVKAYQIVFQPALKSRHTVGAAIGMKVGKIVGKSVKNADGTSSKIVELSDLHAVGQTYGVIKLITDPPHWSDNGR